MSPELITAIRDAIFMFKDIKKSRELPAYAHVQDQYIAQGQWLEHLLEQELTNPSPDATLFE